MEAKKLKRLDFLISNAANRRKETWDIVHQQRLNEFERSYMEAVMWISVATEWFERNAKTVLYTADFDFSLNLSLSKVDRQYLTDEYYYLLGVKQIFNSLKHNVEITNYDNTIYEDFIRNISIQRIIWIDSKDMDFGNKVHHENSFKEHFENKDIIATLLEAEKKLYSLRIALYNTLKMQQSN